MRKKDTYYRAGRIYFRARWIKSREAFKVWWLHNGVEDTLAGRHYSKEEVGTAKKLASRPSNETIRNGVLKFFAAPA